MNEPDDVDDIPIFTRLSPQQRIGLVKDVAVDLWCAEEPLPPESIQHYAAYRALIAYLKFWIGYEIDSACWHNGIGEDLKPKRVPLPIDPRSQEINVDRRIRVALIDYQAENFQEMLDRSGRSTAAVFQPRQLDGSEEAICKRQVHIDTTLFSGPPISPEAREFHRSLSPTEQACYRWRRLADAAFQMHFRDRAVR